MSFSTCRFCKKTSWETPNEGMVKYAVRHWAHWTCGFARFGMRGFVNKLSQYQLTHIPVHFVDSSPELQQAIRERSPR